MGEPDHEQIADRLQDKSDALERHVRELGGEIEHAKDDWERKRADAGVPGAIPPEEPDGEKSGEQDTQSG
jgi:hypothetical protein